MTDLTPLVEEAARTIYEERAAIPPEDPAKWSDASEEAREWIRGHVRAALLAFHNPDSEAGKALVRLVAREIGHAWDPNPDCPGELYSSEAKMLATAAITAIARALSMKEDETGSTETSE